MLGRLRMTVREAIDFYLKLSKKVFAPKHEWNLAAKLLSTAKALGACDSAALEKAIKDAVASKLGEGHGDDLLQDADSRCRVFVCALRADKRSLILFRSYSLSNIADLEPRIWEAGRATSAAPLFFDPIVIGPYGQTFVDGGAGHNNPIQEAYDEALASWPDRDVACIVSIGTGMSPLKAFGQNLKDVGKTIIDIAIETDQTATLFATNHPQYLQYDQSGDAKRLFRFQVAQGLESVGMDEHKKIKDIASATQVYMENRDQIGTKQLSLFQSVIAPTESTGMENFRMSDVPLEPEKVRYLEKHAKALDLRLPPRATAHRFSAATVSLPHMLLSNPETHSPIRGHLALGQSPTWLWVLNRYGEPGLVNDHRRSRLSVQDAIWCPLFGGAFAVEIPVVDIWRIISSFNPFFDSYTNEPNTETEMHVHDLWISVPTELNGQPLVHMNLRPTTIFAPYNRATMPAVKLARAMCGGEGLTADTLCTKPLFRSSAGGWDLVKVPIAFAFTMIPVENRCYFLAQWEWLARRSAAMIDVSFYLWDHADAIDLDDTGIPIKILWEEAMGLLDRDDGRVTLVHDHIDWKLQAIRDTVDAALLALLGNPDDVSVAFVEIEDAVELLVKASEYDASNKVSWDEDGQNQIVDDWWGRFGPDKARWVALHMTLKLLSNMRNALRFPSSFSPLIRSGTGKCFVV
ncbi:MAG: hypothetical protein LQ352_005817 [Teloschistes flavicans]|nr:MAG: hypothetical protein LQ352_005817 [Teloschistes flavicans]